MQAGLFLCVFIHKYLQMRGACVYLWGMEKEIFIALAFSQEGGAGSVASAIPFLFSSQEGRDRFLVSWENEQVSCERTKDAEMSYVGPSGWSYWVELWESTVEI